MTFVGTHLELREAAVVWLESNNRVHAAVDDHKLVKPIPPDKGDEAWIDIQIANQALGFGLLTHNLLWKIECDPAVIPPDGAERPTPRVEANRLGLDF